MRILVLTDSLGLPRSRPEFCAFEDTWPILLKNKFRQVHQVSIGAATTEVLLKQIRYQNAFMPDLAIVQVGIVDCVPRFMSTKELNFTSALGSVGKALRFMLNRKWIRRLRNISFVKVTEFEINLKLLAEELNCPVIVIGILPASSDYEKLLPGVVLKISEYNKVLKSNFAYYLDTNDFIERDGIMTDHHHLNQTGQHIIYKRLEAILDKHFTNG